MAPPTLSSPVDDVVESAVEVESKDVRRLLSDEDGGGRGGTVRFGRCVAMKELRLSGAGPGPVVLPLRVPTPPGPERMPLLYCRWRPEEVGRDFGPDMERSWACSRDGEHDEGGFRC